MLYSFRHVVKRVMTMGCQRKHPTRKHCNKRHRLIDTRNLGLANCCFFVSMKVYAVRIVYLA
jgi:hypothetical protein